MGVTLGASFSASLCNVHVPNAGCVVRCVVAHNTTGNEIDLRLIDRIGSREAVATRQKSLESGMGNKQDQPVAG